MDLQAELKLRKVSKSQAEVITEQDGKIQNLTRQLGAVIAEYKKMGQALADFQNTDYRRGQVNQAVSFAIKSEKINTMALKPDAVMEVAAQYYELIDRETQRLFDIDKAAFEAKQAEAELKQKEDAEPN